MNENSNFMRNLIAWKDRYLAMQHKRMVFGTILMVVGFVMAKLSGVSFKETLANVLVNLF